MVYYFSGGLTYEMANLLKSMPGFEPIDVLVSQLDRSSVDTMLKHKANGVVKSLFIDSGAYSEHTGKGKVDLEDYINFVNSIDEHISAVAQLDTIPGEFNKPKSPEDYVESAAKSWENFEYMYEKLKSPEKLIPVFHFGESFSVLEKMLSWKDKNGKPLTYVGISPANDSAQKTKNKYLQNVYDVIRESSNPNVRTHLFGMTALDALSKFPCYSADSVSHRLMGAYGKVLIPEFGVISVSKKTRTSKTKSNMSFLDTADDMAMARLKAYLDSINVTVEDLQASHSVRCAVSMYSIMKILKDKPYDAKNTKRVKKLFDLR